MTRCAICHWKSHGFKIAVALLLMGFLPACDRAGSAPVHSEKTGLVGQKATTAFKARYAIFLYRARPDAEHPYDQPVTEKRVVVLT